MRNTVFLSLPFHDARLTLVQVVRFPQTSWAQVKTRGLFQTVLCTVPCHVSLTPLTPNFITFVLHPKNVVPVNPQWESPAFPSYANAGVEVSISLSPFVLVRPLAWRWNKGCHHHLEGMFHGIFCGKPMDTYHILPYFMGNHQGFRLRFSLKARHSIAVWRWVPFLSGHTRSRSMVSLVSIPPSPATDRCGPAATSLPSAGLRNCKFQSGPVAQ